VPPHSRAVSGRPNLSKARGYAQAFPPGIFHWQPVPPAVNWQRMTRPPLILISPSIEKAGSEFGDRSISLSEAYPRAVADAGGVPLTLPVGKSRALIAACVRCCDGVLLTGGDDIEPRLYGNGLPAKLRRKVSPTPDGGERDLRELILIDEVFRQRKPLLAICRGHQLLNLALGGTIIADIAAQVPNALNHRRLDRRSDVVHEVRLTRESLLSKITGRQTLGVNSTHHQAVGRVAEPFQAIATSRDGIVEGMELKSEATRLLPFLLSMQFHPERLADRYPEHRAVFCVFTQACVLHRIKKL
jgi:putative glutamine amidotransferase